ncbi:MAG: TolC family protein [Candidatus Eisenbacteria bacterium]
MNPLIRTLATTTVASLALAVCARAEDAPPASLRLGYGDAVRLATRGAATVQLADLKTVEAGARVGQARGLLLPTLGGSAAAGNHTVDLAAQGIQLPGIPEVIGPFDAVDARARVEQPLLDLASWQRLGAAHQGQLQSDFDRDASAEGAAQTAALAYLAAARAQALVGARESDLAIAEELAGMAEAQLAAGTSPQIDVTRARTEVTSARGALLLARYQAKRSRIDLARALSLDPTTSIALADTLDGALGASTTPDTTLAGAIEHRPEVQSETARRARADAERSAIGYERIGRLDVSADWGWSGEHFDNSQWTRDYQVAYSIPIFDGLRRESRIDEQAAVVRESDVRLRDLHDQVSAEVEQARIGLDAAIEQFDVAIERLHLSEQELAEARDRFVNGVAGNLDVIQAQSNLVRARDAEVDTRYFIAVARVALARATGVARDLR